MSSKFAARLVRDEPAGVISNNPGWLLQVQRHKCSEQVKVLLFLIPLYRLPLVVKSEVVLTMLIFTFVLSILAVGFNIVFGAAGQLTMFHAAAFGPRLCALRRPDFGRRHAWSRSCSSARPMLEVSREGRVGIVSLNRPERRNAMDCGLVKGEAPGFCAGSDLKFIGRLPLEDTPAGSSPTPATCRG